MTNKKVVEAFLNHEGAQSLNMYSTGKKLFSYNTVIAEFINGYLVGNSTNYSRTTSKHMSLVRDKIQIWTVPNTIIERGTSSLINYI